MAEENSFESLELQEMSVLVDDLNKLFDQEQTIKSAQPGLNFYFKSLNESSVLINYVEASANHEGSRSIILKTMNISLANNFSIDLPLPLFDDAEIMQILSGRVNPTAEEKNRAVSEQHKLGVVFLQNSLPMSSFKPVSAVRQSCFVMTIPAYVRLMDFIKRLYKSVKSKMVSDLDVMQKVGQFPVDRNLSCLGSCKLTNLHCLDSRDEIKLWLVMTLSAIEAEPKLTLMYEHQRQLKQFPVYAKNVEIMSQPETLTKFLAEYKDAVMAVPASVNMAVPASVNMAVPASVDTSAHNTRPVTPMKNFTEASTIPSATPNSSLLCTPPPIAQDSLLQPNHHQQQRQVFENVDPNLHCSEILTAAMKDILCDGGQTQYDYSTLQQQQQQQPHDQYFQLGHQHIYNGYFSQTAARTQGYVRSGSAFQQQQQTAFNNLMSTVDQVTENLKASKDSTSSKRSSPSTVSEQKSPNKKAKTVTSSCYPSNSSKITSTLTAIEKLRNGGDVTLSYASASPSGASVKNNPRSLLNPQLQVNNKHNTSRSAPPLSRPESNKTSKGGRSHLDRNKRLDSDGENDFHKKPSKK